MKKFAILIFLTTLLSCSKNNLSCDPVINLWAQEHLMEYTLADRSAIIELPLGRQRAIYSGLPAERKVELWVEKINYLIANEDLSPDEIGKLEELVSFTKPFHYSSNYGRKEHNLFLSKWESNVREAYGWDDEKFFMYLCTWMTPKEFYKAIELDHPIVTKGGPEQSSNELKDCECIYSVYCQFRENGVCTKGSCNEGGNCGIMGNSNCTGMCS